MLLNGTLKEEKQQIAALLSAAISNITLAQ